MVGLSDLGVSKEHVLVIRQTIEPYLVQIAKFLAAPQLEEKQETVNCEQESRGRSQFTGARP